MISIETRIPKHWRNEGKKISRTTKLTILCAKNDKLHGSGPLSTLKVRIETIPETRKQKLMFMLICSFVLASIHIVLSTTSFGFCDVIDQRIYLTPHHPLLIFRTGLFWTYLDHKIYCARCVPRRNMYIKDCDDFWKRPVFLEDWIIDVTISMTHPHQPHKHELYIYLFCAIDLPVAAIFGTKEKNYTYHSECLCCIWVLSHLKRKAESHLELTWTLCLPTPSWKAISLLIFGTFRGNFEKGTSVIFGVHPSSARAILVKTGREEKCSRSQPMAHTTHGHPRHINWCEKREKKEQKDACFFSFQR